MRRNIESLREITTQKEIDEFLKPGDTYTIETFYVKENIWQWLLRKIRKQPRRLQVFTAK